MSTLTSQEIYTTLNLDNSDLLLLNDTLIKINSQLSFASPKDLATLRSDENNIPGLIIFPNTLKRYQEHIRISILSSATSREIETRGISPIQLEEPLL